MATDTSSTGRDSDKFMLRFPDGIRELIAEAAKRSGRSMNAEIVARLRATFDRDQVDQLTSLATAHRVQRELFNPEFAKSEEAKQLVRELALDLRAKVENVLEASTPIDRFDELLAGSQKANAHAATLDQIYELLDRQQREVRTFLKERETKLSTTLAELYEKAVARHAHTPKVYDGETVEWKTYDVVVRGNPVRLRMGPYINGERGDDFEVTEVDAPAQVLNQSGQPRESQGAPQRRMKFGRDSSDPSKKPTE